MNFKSGIAPIVSIIAIVIIVAGIVVAWQYLGEKDEGPVAGEQEEEEEEEEEEEFADWKTYRNEEYGFEVKYPLDWQFEKVIKEQGYKITMKCIERCQLSINYRNVYDPSLGRNWTIDELIENSFAYSTKEFIVIDGIEGQKVTGFLNHGMYPFFTLYLQKPNDEKIYEVTFEGFDAKAETFDQIISSFRFIETETSSRRDLLMSFDDKIDSIDASMCEQWSADGMKPIWVAGKLTDISKRYSPAYERNEFTLIFQGFEKHGEIYIGTKNDSVPYEIGKFYKFDLGNECKLIYSMASSGMFFDPDLNNLKYLNECI